MFFHLIFENESGDRIDMTTTANRYMTSKVEGLSPPPCTISTSSYAGMDGSYLNNAFIEKRNVVIHFEMRGVGIEARRHQLYKVVKPSRYIKIYYKTAGIDVFTEGYVETCEVNNFEMFTTGQISILCPDIYWYANETQTAEYSQVLGAFHFICPDDDKPFPIGRYNTENMMTIVNDGDDTGITLVISGGPARNPTIYNADTDEYMQIQGEIEEGDIITITTKTGNKTVTLEREGITTNIINRLVSGSTWLTLREGENRFYLRAADALRLADTDESLQGILDLKNELQRNGDRKNDLRKLRVKGFLDAAMYNQELRRVEMESEEIRAKMKCIDRAGENGDIDMKETICLVIGAIGAGIASLFGGWDSALVTLIIFMGVDFATGLITGAMGKSKHSKSGKLNSKAGWYGLAKKCSILMLIIVAVRLDILLNTNYVRDAVCIGFCVNELLSIVENTSLMGIPYPPALKNAIEVLQKQTGRKDDNDD